MNKRESQGKFIQKIYLTMLFARKGFWNIFLSYYRNSKKISRKTVYFLSSSITEFMLLKPLKS